MLAKGLVIDEPWIGMILRGDKTWEMRKKPCRIRGTIALIKKGSKHVVGTAELVSSLPPLSAADFAAREDMHCIPGARQEKAMADGWKVPWVLANIHTLRRPVPYNHPSGAVIWVTLDPDVVRSVESQCSN